MLWIVRLQLEIVTMPTAETLAMPVHRVTRRVAGDGVAITAPPVRVTDHYPGGAVETVLQVVADHAEIRQPHPTGLYRTRARHAVTLALLTHL